MEPSFRHGDIVLVNKLSYLFKKPKVGDVVVVKKTHRYILKRIQKIENGKYFVVGDNKKESTDSRTFGWIKRKDIVRKVIKKISKHSN